MKKKLCLMIALLALPSAVFLLAQPHKKDSASASVMAKRADEDSMRLEGEQRFRANCGRCHAAPQKFPPRMMATVVRHMRVRATITNQEMQSILRYLTH
jgi:mono/diheme cytochrome c family protein